MRMPAAFAASRIDVPAGTETGRPSIVRLTVCGPGEVISRYASSRWLSRMRAVSCEGGHEKMRLLLDQRLEVAAELLESRDHGRCTGIAEHTDRLARHVVGDLEQRVEVLRRPIADSDALEN